MQSKLEYSTKPTLKDFLKQQQESRRLRERPPQPSDVRRSLSSTGRLDQSQSLTNSKYAKAKPKICTRPSSSTTTTQSARTHDDLKSPGDQSKQNFNDSYTMRLTNFPFSLFRINYSNQYIFYIERLHIMIGIILSSQKHKKRLRIRDVNKKTKRREKSKYKYYFNNLILNF